MKIQETTVILEFKFSPDSISSNNLTHFTLWTDLLEVVQTQGTVDVTHSDPHG